MSESSGAHVRVTCPLRREPARAAGYVSESRARRGGPPAEAAGSVRGWMRYSSPVCIGLHFITVVGCIASMYCPPSTPPLPQAPLSLVPAGLAEGGQGWRARRMPAGAAESPGPSVWQWQRWRAPILAKAAPGRRRVQFTPKEGCLSQMGSASGVGGRADPPLRCSVMMVAASPSQSSSPSLASRPSRPALPGSRADPRCLASWRARACVRLRGGPLLPSETECRMGIVAADCRVRRAPL